MFYKLQPEYGTLARKDGAMIGEILNLGALHPVMRVGLLQYIVQSLRTDGLNVHLRVQGLDAYYYTVENIDGGE